MIDSRHDGDIHASSAWRGWFLVAIAALLLGGSLVMQQYRRFAAATSELEHTYDVLDLLDRITARVADARSAFHGYLLTRNRSFLGPYEGADAQTRIQLSHLLELVADDPEQEARCRRLINLTNDSLAEMERVLELSDSRELAAAMTRLGERHGQRLSDELHNVAAEMRSAERSLFAERAGQARLARRASLGFALVGLLGAVALAFVAVSIDRNFERRRTAFLRESSARMAAEHEASAAAADLKRSESFTQSMLDHSGDCIQVLDPDGRIVLANRPGLALMEVDDADALLGQSWTPLWNADAGLARRAVEEAVTRGEGRFQAFRSTARGTPKWWDVIVTPVRDEHGRVHKLVTISRDFTNQKHAEQERAQLLSRERAARSEAERAARLKDDFVSTLSHELRTPLNAIVGWIGVLKQQQSPETLAKAIDVIDRNSRRQSQIVDDLLDVSRIMSGKLRLDVQRVDLSSVIEEAVASAKPAADARGVHLLTILGSAAAIQGDPGRLQQIVWNLVSNAIKFTPRGGMVQVTLGKGDNHVRVEVSDTGLGIRADVLPQIFQRFRQGDASSTRHHGGLGLGLAIVKSLAEMHGGSVDAVSEGEGHGSVFTVRLPLALAASPSEPTPDTRRIPPAVGTLLDGVRALVLDDEPDARELVQRLLEDAGGQVQTAASASDAMAVLERGFAPDIILSDIGMPDEDGYAFMQRVRHMQGPVSGVPAAALTALARVEDRSRALMSGYQTHLAKPVDPVELIAMVASLTGRTGRAIG